MGKKKENLTRAMKKKVKYCVGLNCRANNIEAILIARAKDIYEVYAAAPSNISPTGRRGNIPIGLKELKRQVGLAHKYGVRYNILMNGSCFGGLEFSSAFQNRMSNFVKYLDEIGVDSTTVMNPFLVDLVRKNSQQIEIIVSSLAEVTELVKIERLRSRGANRVVLHQNVYRNFEMLKTIRKSTDLALEIIPNQGCLNQCDCFISHINIVAHSSIVTDEEIKSFGEFNFPIQRCREIRQTDPIESLMSSFIRPEDVCLYEEMGFDIFKFAGRRSSTEWMLHVLDAYISRSYEGNVFNLSAHVGENHKICNLPNKVLDGWYQYVGGNSEYNHFRKRAIEFYQHKNIDQYFSKKYEMAEEI